MTGKPKKTGFITGASLRIGRAVALKLAGRGMNVVAHHHRSKQAAETLRAELEALGAKAWLVEGDLSDRGAVPNLFRLAEEKAGAIDLLVNNASIFPESQVNDFSGEELDLNMQVNAFAPLTLCRAFAAQNRGGVIVNLLDTRITHGDSNHAAYHLSKQALFHLTKMLAIEFAPSIRVNAVAPGLILPPPGKDESYLQSMKGLNPLQRAGSVEGVAEAVAFLVDSDFITGQVLFVDGGQHMRGSFPA